MPERVLSICSPVNVAESPFHRFTNYAPATLRGVNERNRLWVLKKGYSEAEVGGVWVPRRRVSCAGWKLGRHGERRSGHLTEKRTNRLMFWAAAARKNCSRTNFILRKRSRRICRSR